MDLGLFQLLPLMIFLILIKLLKVNRLFRVIQKSKSNHMGAWGKILRFGLTLDNRLTLMENIPLQPAPSEPVGGDVGVRLDLEMWASRALNIAYLPRCDHWHNPCLLSGSLREAVYSCNTPVIPNDPHETHSQRDSEPRVRTSGAAQAECRPVWYWRVEPTFAAWCYRAIQRAKTANITLPIVFYEAFQLIRDEIEKGQGQSQSRWGEVEALARGPPGTVKLPNGPGSAFFDALTNHARYGLCPKWIGWEKDAARLDAAEAAREEAVDMERMRAGLEAATATAVFDPVVNAQSR